MEQIVQTRPHAFGLIQNKGDSSEVVKNTAGGRGVRTRKAPRNQGRKELQGEGQSQGQQRSVKLESSSEFDFPAVVTSELFCQRGQEPDCSGLQSEWK